MRMRHHAHERRDGEADGRAPRAYNPSRWGLIGAKAVVVSPQVDGCGCLDLGFEYQDNRLDCMQLSVTAVETAIKQFIP